MRHFHKTNNKYHCPTVNLDRIWSLVSEQTKKNYAAKKDGPAPVIDCVQAVCFIAQITLICSIYTLFL